MKVRELVEKLEYCDPDQEVYFRNISDITSNISAVRRVDKSAYSFFGKSIPCIILEKEEKE